MKTLKYTIAILAVSVAAFSQTPDPSQQGGRFIAANYGQWQAQVQSFIAGVACVQPITFTLYNNSSFRPWNTNAPITIGFETVTPTSFDFITVPGQVCIHATYLQAHFAGDTVKSGTAGLQEALNLAGVNGGVVTIDSNWSSLGGTNGIKAAAVVPGNVSIEDARSGLAGAGGPITDKGGQVFNVLAYGAVGNGSTVNATCVANTTAVNTAITAASTSGGIVLFPPGIYCLNQVITGVTGIDIAGSGWWNTVLVANPTLSLSTHFLISNNLANCSGSTFTGCPSNFSLHDLTINANCGTYNGTSNCATGGRGGTGTGDALHYDGLQWQVYRTRIYNAPHDGFYREMQGGGTTSAFNGAPTLGYGNASVISDVREGYNGNVAAEDYGPPDSQRYTEIGFFSTNQNLIVGCTAGGACGSLSYYIGGHYFHNLTGSGVDNCDIFVAIHAEHLQCENNQVSGAFNINIDHGPNIGSQAQNFGAIIGSVNVNNGSGGGIRINSPQSTDTSFGMANDIAIWSFANTQTGITCTASAIATQARGTSRNNGTDISWLCPGSAEIDTAGSSGGDNSINQFKANNLGVLVNFQGNAGAITGTGAAAVIYTVTIPSYCTNVGHAIEVETQFLHSAGSAAITYTWAFQGTTFSTYSVTNTAPNLMEQRMTLGMISASTASGAIHAAISNTSATLLSGSSAGGTPFTVTNGTPSTLTFNFNVANTDTVSPRTFEVKCY